MKEEIVKIPLPDHLVRFVTAQYWFGIPGPYKVDIDSPVGRIVRLALLEAKLDPEWESHTSCESRSCIELILPDRLKRLSPELRRLSRIEVYLEENLKEALRSWVLSLQASGNNRWYSMIMFLEYYGIRTTQSEDRYYRWLKRQAYLDKRIYDRRKAKESQQEKDRRVS